MIDIDGENFSNKDKRVNNEGKKLKNGNVEYILKPFNELLVENISTNEEKEDIISSFYSFGEIDKVIILKDKEANKSRGICFVKYKN